MAGLGGITSKLKSNAGTLGLLAGFYTTAKKKADAWGGQSAMSMIEMAVNGVINDPHVPNISHLINDVQVRDGLKTGVMVWIGGEVLDAVGLAPGYAEPLKKAGWGIVKGALAFGLVMKSGLDHSGGDPAGQPYGGHDGYPAGARYSPLGRRNGGYFTMPTVPPATATLPVILPASPKP